MILELQLHKWGVFITQNSNICRHFPYLNLHSPCSAFVGLANATHVGLINILSECSKTRSRVSDSNWIRNLKSVGHVGDTVELGSYWCSTHLRVHNNYKQNFLPKNTMFTPGILHLMRKPGINLPSFQKLCELHLRSGYKKHPNVWENTTNR